MTTTRHDDVLQVKLSHWRSRLVRYSVNVYLVRGVLVDTGFPAARGRLARLLDELRPTAVVVTHHHEDHAGNADVAARRGLPIAMAPDTLALLRAGERGVGLYRRFVWSTMPPLADAITPLPDDALATLGLALLHMPGHSGDHRVVWDANRATLFGGDLFLGVRVKVARPNEDPRAHARSLRAAAALQPRRLFDGHRGLVPDPVRALLAKADWLDETIGRIDALATQGWSVRAIRREVLGAEDPVALASFGDLSKANFVRAVLKGGTGDARPRTRG